MHVSPASGDGGEPGVLVALSRPGVGSTSSGPHFVPLPGVGDAGLTEDAAVTAVDMVLRSFLHPQQAPVAPCIDVAQPMVPGGDLGGDEVNSRPAIATAAASSSGPPLVPLTLARRVVVDASGVRTLVHVARHPHTGDSVVVTLTRPLTGTGAGAGAGIAKPAFTHIVALAPDTPVHVAVDLAVQRALRAAAVLAEATARATYTHAASLRRVCTLPDGTRVLAHVTHVHDDPRVVDVKCVVGQPSRACPPLVQRRVRLSALQPCGDGPMLAALQHVLRDLGLPPATTPSAVELGGPGEPGRCTDASSIITPALMPTSDAVPDVPRPSPTANALDVPATLVRMASDVDGHRVLVEAQWCGKCRRRPCKWVLCTCRVDLCCCMCTRIPYASQPHTVTVNRTKQAGVGECEEGVLYVSCPWLRTPPPPCFCAGVGEATTLDLAFRTRTGDTASISLTLPQLRTALGTSQRAVFAITRESCEAILEDVVRVCALCVRSPLIRRSQLPSLAFAKTRG